ncbi:unnamed protein product [Caenorhabditis bovis]|uniref:Uncharacterized protein n=1 Tax=Caenorhabditis bovis TaxID=2654633 RepID=A0A8S1FA67_9PELO|nr:unnamed protein product [Caenorhabditis bovis]
MDESLDFDFESDNDDYEYVPNEFDILQKVSAHEKLFHNTIINPDIYIVIMSLTFLIFLVSKRKNSRRMVFGLYFLIIWPFFIVAIIHLILRICEILLLKTRDQFYLIIVMTGSNAPYIFDLILDSVYIPILFLTISVQQFLLNNEYPNITVIKYSKGIMIVQQKNNQWESTLIWN